MSAEPLPLGGLAESLPSGGELAEAAAMPWRRRIDERKLRRAERRWTTWTVAIGGPFFVVAAFLIYLEPMLFLVSLWSIAHGLAIPELYARRGVRSTIPLGGSRSAAGRAPAGAESLALGLLGDLLDHRSRELVSRTGLALERGRLGVWLVGERGAVLLRPGGRRADCWCVRIADVEGLPAADRISHLLLALREDEYGFATVANVNFSGSRRRVRRALEARSRPAIDAAMAALREPAGQS